MMLDRSYSLWPAQMDHACLVIVHLLFQGLLCVSTHLPFQGTQLVFSRMPLTRRDIGAKLPGSRTHPQLAQLQSSTISWNSFPLREKTPGLEGVALHTFLYSHTAVHKFNSWFIICRQIQSQPGLWNKFCDQDRGVI